MITPEDVYFARAVGDSGALPIEVLQTILAELDALASASGLAALLVERGRLGAEQANALVPEARAALEQRGDAIYASLVMADGVAVELVERYRASPGPKRFGLRLVDSGVVTAARDAALVARARSLLVALERAGVQQLRARGFVLEAVRRVPFGSGAVPALPPEDPARSLEAAEKGAADARAIFPSLGDPFSAVRSDPGAIPADRAAPPEESTTPFPGVSQKPTTKYDRVLSTPGPDALVETVKHDVVFPLPVEKAADLAPRTPPGTELPAKPRKEDLDDEAQAIGHVEGVAPLEDGTADPFPGAPQKPTAKYDRVLRTPEPDGMVETVKHDVVFPLPVEAAGLGGEAEVIARVLPAYELERSLGRGPMGVVYLATEKALKRQVALKVLAPGGDAGAVTRFMREARAIAALDHPAIVPVFAYGEAEGTYFIAMKYLEGKPLSSLEPGPLPPQRAAAIVAQAARGLAHAHERNVMHRDVKPSNIIVGSGDRAWLVDFGIAKLAAEPSVSRKGQIVGAPPYMSPEQTGSAPLTGQTDVYSLGAVLYATITGRAPFEGPSPVEILTRVAREEPPRPSTLVPGLPANAETIILGAMRKDPEKRYEGAGALADDLERFARGEPILGPRPTAAGRVRFATTRRASLAAAAVMKDPSSLPKVVALAFVLGAAAAAAVGFIAWSVWFRR